MTLSVRNSLKTSRKSLSLVKNNLMKNDMFTNMLLFIIIALTISYLVNKNYDAIIFLYVISIVIFYMSKNVFYSLLISIILTNLFLSLGYFYVNNPEKNKEGLINIKKDKKHQKKDKKDKKDKKEKKEKKD